jgi:hypothetical protein
MLNCPRTLTAVALTMLALVSVSYDVHAQQMLARLESARGIYFGVNLD